MFLPIISLPALFVTINVKPVLILQKIVLNVKLVLLEISQIIVHVTKDILNLILLAKNVY
jgi:hypothetical protein